MVLEAGETRLPAEAEYLHTYTKRSEVMYKYKVLMTAVFICLAVSASNAANVIYVDASSPNDPGSGTFEDPFRRIKTGIDAAVEGDTVLIRPGVYTGPGNFDLDPQSKSIIIRSSNPNDPNVVAQTIIDPNQAGRGFYIHSGEDANCIISGMTIEDACVIDGDNGAGIYCFDSSPTIRNCVIQNGHAVEGSGGGICFDYGNATVINCTITGNIADYYGGGIGLRFSSPTIIGCTISGNIAILEGGGIDSGASEPNIFNCIIIDNNSSLGGGINCYYPGVANVFNCTIVANSADNIGGAIHCWTQGSAVIENSILWANSSSDGTQLGMDYEGTISVAYCDIQGGQTDVYDPCGLLAWGEGNIDIDPCFASFDPKGDPNLWDFHLQSAYGRWEPKDQNWVMDSNTSQCVDAGDPNSDWSAEPWPNGKRINMGAFGGTNQASKNGLKADFDVDGYVNFVDFSYLAANWNLQQRCIEDLNSSGDVDIYDLEEFCVSWLEQN
jgi:parallel beta-helix repeat protein